MNKLFKKTTAVLLSIFMIITQFPMNMILAQEEPVYDIYVSIDGNDETADGTKQQPYKTLDKARLVARNKHKGEQPVSVFVDKGTYFVDEAICFTKEDSNVTYIGNEAVLTGAKTLSNLQWSDYKDGIKVADVEKNLGIDQLFIDGQQQILARYPNYQADQPLQGSTSQANIKARSANWNHPEGGYIRALHDRKWGGNSYVITGKNQSSIGLSYYWVGDNNRGSGMHGDHVMVENIFEELDAPGEWYYDQAQGKLYVYPTDSMNLNQAVVEGAVNDEILRIEGEQDQALVKNIKFDGFTLENTKRTMFTGKYVPLMRSDWCVVRKGALFVQDAENIRFEDGVIRNIGGNGVFVSGHAKDIVVNNNEILNIGSSGILVAGKPDSCREPSFWGHDPMPEVDPYYVHKTSVDDITPGPAKEHYPEDVVISNNHIQGVGVFEKQSSQVAISVAHNVSVVHNTIHEGPRAGINVGDGTFGGHEIAYNDVFDVQRETDDHGMFNSWGRDRFWSLGGYDTLGNNGVEKEKYSLIDVIDTIKIHDNRMHFGGRVDGGSTFGIDLDDGSSNYDIYNNLCLNMGIKLREGFHRRVHNNILINGSFNLHCTFYHSNDEIKNNIVIKGNPFSLAATGKDRFLHSKDIIDHNCYYDFGMKEMLPEYWNEINFDIHSINTDPKFKNPSNNDYTVMNQNLLDEIGFVNFAMDQFGKPGCKYQAPIYEKHEADGNQDIYEREEWLGATISALDDAIMSSTGAGGLDGVYLEKVPTNSIAAQYGLQTGDVIKVINGITIGKKSTFTTKYNTVPTGNIVTMNLIRNQLKVELNFTKVDVLSYIDDIEEQVIYKQSDSISWEVSNASHYPDNAVECYQKSMTYAHVTDANRKDAVVQVTFKGTQIELISRKEGNMGNYKFVITNKNGDVLQEALASAHAESKKDQQVIFKSNKLPYDDYTLTLTCESGDYLIVDAFRVTTMEADQDAVCVSPIQVTSKGTRVEELVSDTEMNIEVPIKNIGKTDLSLTIATVINGQESALLTEQVEEKECVLLPNEKTIVKFSLQTPKNSEAKRLEVMIYDKKTGKPYAANFKVAGSQLVNKEVSYPSVESDKIVYTYDQKDSLLRLATTGFAKNAQVIVCMKNQQGELVSIQQLRTDKDGNIQTCFQVPSEFNDDARIDIVDEKQYSKSCTLHLNAKENIIDKKQLEAAIEQAKSLMNDEASRTTYTKESWTKLYTTYYQALAAMDKKNVSQEQVDHLTTTLMKSITSLTICETKSMSHYHPSFTTVHKNFEIYSNDNHVDAGNRDGKKGDQWQVRNAQVDATVPGSYAEFKGTFKTFKVYGANKHDSANFRIEIIDDDTQEKVVKEVNLSKNQYDTVQLFDAGELSGKSQTIRIYHNDQEGNYLELRDVEYTELHIVGEKVPSLKSVEITKLPDQVMYEVNDQSLSLIGGMITETYQDGSSIVVEMNQTMYKDGFDTTTKGKKTIMISHCNQDLMFTIDVYQPETYYTLTVENGIGSGKYVEGSKIEIQADEREGMTFAGWSAVAGTVQDSTQSHTFFIMPNCDVTVTALYKPVQKPEVIISNLSISLKENIGVNYYLSVNDLAKKDQQAHVIFTRQDQTSIIYTMEQILANEVIVENNTYYKVSIPMAARQMNDTIEATFITGDGNKTVLQALRVCDYAKTILKDSQFSQETKAVVEAMLNYGAMAQLYFDYNVEHLANENVSHKDYETVTPQQLNSYASVVSNDDIQGLTYKGTNLRLLSKTTIRHHFNVDFSQRENLEFYIEKNDEKIQLTPVYYDQNKAYIEIENILVENLDKPYTITILNKLDSSKKMTIEYSAFSYAYAVLIKEDASVKIKNVMKSLVDYNIKALAYKESLHK